MGAKSICFCIFQSVPDGEPFGTGVCSTINIFVLAASLKHDFIIVVPLDAPHKPLTRLKALSKLTLLGGNLYINPERMSTNRTRKFVTQNVPTRIASAQIDRISLQFVLSVV